MGEQESSKIHVDDDWKRQAQKEKEELSAKTTPAGEEGGAAIDAPLPPPSLSWLVNMMVTQILLYLGDIANPATGQRMKNLDLAKHNIDTLQVLEEKTRGNLSDEEKELLETALYEVRMRYVQAASRPGG